jgi:peptidoglycan hydrolase-like protein with peptidoglycan-binding domain
MKGLYKLAMAFEKASQLASIDPDRVGPNSTPDPRVQKAPANLPSHPSKPASDPNVMRQQLCLINLGFPLAKGADGIMGPDTQNAINAFKAKYKLTNSSPDIVAKRIEAEADKILGGVSEESSKSMNAFAIPGSPDAAANPAGPAAIDFKSLDNSGANANGFVGNGPAPQRRIYQK